MITGIETALGVNARGDQVDRAFAVLQARALNLQAALGVTGAQACSLPSFNSGRPTTRLAFGVLMKLPPFTEIPLGLAST